MPKDQARIDAEKHITDRLDKWKHESAKRYELADVDPVDCLQDIFICLMSVLCDLCLKTGISPEMVGKAMVHTVHAAKKLRAERGESND